MDLGLVSTPAFYFARDFYGINPGVMVTASHNPAVDNGFKIILGELPVTPGEMQALQDFMEGDVQSRQARAGRVEQVDILPEYLSARSSQLPQLAGLKVIIDCANGVGVLAARPLWRASGAEVDFLYDRIDGNFPHHPPNPARPENLEDLGAAVRKMGADLGIALDGDGDRVAFVDGQGIPLPNDQVIMLFARRALQEKPAPVVFDQKCSSIVKEAILAAGGDPVMERSGHTFIKTSFIKIGAPYAGELSGHHFFRSINGDDGMMAAFYLSDILVKSGKSMAALVESLPRYPVTPDIRLPMERAAIKRVLRDLQGRLGSQSRLVDLDGVRLEFEDGWGLARPSVTEPVITLRFEGKTRQALDRIMRSFEEAAPDLKAQLVQPDQLPGFANR